MKRSANICQESWVSVTAWPPNDALPLAIKQLRSTSCDMPRFLLQVFVLLVIFSRWLFHRDLRRYVQSFSQVKIFPEIL